MDVWKVYFCYTGLFMIFSYRRMVSYGMSGTIYTKTKYQVWVGHQLSGSFTTVIWNNVDAYDTIRMVRHISTSAFVHVVVAIVVVSTYLYLTHYTCNQLIVYLTVTCWHLCTLKVPASIIYWTIPTLIFKM